MIQILDKPHLRIWKDQQLSSCHVHEFGARRRMHVIQWTGSITTADDANPRRAPPMNMKRSEMMIAPYSWIRVRTKFLPGQTSRVTYVKSGVPSYVCIFQILIIEILYTGQCWSPTQALFPFENVSLHSWSKNNVIFNAYPFSWCIGKEILWSTPFMIGKLYKLIDTLRYFVHFCPFVSCACI